MKMFVRIWPVVFPLLLVCCSEGGWPVDSLMENGETFTAGYRYIAVENLALSLDTTLRLQSISTSDMDPEGRAPSWSYTFRGCYLPYEEYHFTATPGTVRFDSISTMGLGAARISRRWINSNVAAQNAESQGGGTFRRNNPNYQIYASLGEAVVPNPTPFWHFAYRSRLDPGIRLWISVDASATVPG
jgi:hypothetical protein